MELIPEIEGLRSVMAIIITLLHCVLGYTVWLPLKPLVESNQAPSNLAVGLIEFGITALLKALVDVFFLISATIITMQFLELLDKNEQRQRNSFDARFLVTSWACKLAHRACRMYSIIVPLVLVFALVITSDGALQTLGFINNYVSITKQALQHTWSVAVTMQASVLLPFAVLAASKTFGKRGVLHECLFLGGLLVLATATRVYVVHTKFASHPILEPLAHRHANHLGPSLLDGFKSLLRTAGSVDCLVWEDPHNNETMRSVVTWLNVVYTPTHMRVGTFFAGAILGRVLYHEQHEGVTLHSRFADLLWTGAYLVFGTMSYLAETAVDRRWTIDFEHVLAACFITVWLFVAIRRAGVVGRATSWVLLSKPLQWLAPYTFSLYMTHPLMVLLFALTPPERSTGTDFDPWTVFTVKAFLASVFLAVLAREFVEKPLTRSPGVVAAVFGGSKKDN